jgi:hypothetical protein
MVDPIDDLDRYLDNIKVEGLHLAEVSAIRFQNGKDGRNWDIIKFEVIDSDSPIHGEEFERWVQDFSHLSVADYQSLSGRDKAAVRTARKRWYDNLRAIGYTHEEAQEIRRDPKSELCTEAKGRQVRIEVQVRENNGNEFRNITKIMPVADDDGNESNPPF